MGSPHLLPPKRGKRTELAEWLAKRRPACIGLAEWEELRAALAPVSDAYLRRLVRDSGVALVPLVEGVRQEDLAALERTLLALLAEDRRAARRLVIEARQHAQWAVSKHPEKQEMILWMRTWLENPDIFPAWVALRKRVLHEDTKTVGS
jgi:hypothetical protein